MRILFVTSEHPGFLFGGLGTFTREYVRELRKFADVKCVYFHLSDAPLPLPDETVDYVLVPQAVFEAFSPDARILEVAASFRAQLAPIIDSFKPDVIHCNDRQTYLPFRFEKNVFYSSHLIFTDLLTANSMNDIYFQEVKVERCALENSAVVGVYSDFSAKCALKVAGGKCAPVVLPLGLRTEKFYRNKRKQRNDGVLNVSFFGRFEDVQKGINDFIHAVNLLGPKFKQRNNVRFHLYGRGTVEFGQDLSLFEKPEFLEGQELYDAYANSDIVVMPSRYEPFGFTGIEAMASGALLLVREGFGMDMYAEPGRNCLSLPENPEDMAVVLRNAVLDYDKLSVLQDNAVRTAMEWTWKRCVKSHLYIYRQICAGRIPQICSAYRMEERMILDSYKKSNDVEKVHCAEMERISASCVLESIKAELNGTGRFGDNAASCMVCKKTDGFADSSMATDSTDCTADKVVACGENCKKIDGFENDSGGIEGTPESEISGTLNGGTECTQNVGTAGTPNGEIECTLNGGIEGTPKNILVITGNYEPEEMFGESDDLQDNCGFGFGKNVHFVSVLNEGKDGIAVRLECLPFKDGEFDKIIVAGAWESVLDPCGSLMELERVAKESVLVLYKKGRPYSWQTFQMENQQDWEMINNSEWDCEFKNHIVMEKTVPYGAVIYKHSRRIEEIRNENFA